MTIKAKIYHGEVRRIYPTPEYPDPAKAALTDPEGVFTHWMSGRHPHPPGSSYGIWDTHPETGEMYVRPANPITAGVHWTTSPQAIPERFTEGAFLEPQKGMAMPKRESNYITAEETVEQWHGGGGRDAALEEHWAAIDRGETRQQFETPAHIQQAEKLVERRQYKDPAYRDLGGDTSVGGQISRPFHMGVVWHGHYTPDMVDPNNPPTNYEDEVNLKSGVNVPIHAARFSIPQSGVATYDQKIWHPTPSIVMAGADRRGWAASGFGHVHEKGLVPWNVVQFKNAELPIEGQRKFWRV